MDTGAGFCCVLAFIYTNYIPAFYPPRVENLEELYSQLRSELECLRNSNGDVAYNRRMGGDDMGQAVIGFSFFFV